MHVSLEWLGDLVDITGLKPEEIAEALTMSGLEVEEVEYIKPRFSSVYTAKVLEIEQHPNADKIRLVTVDFGKGMQKVVCGAQNVEVGQIIAFATEGATVFSRKDNSEFKLKKTKIRGVESSGMICSTSELGLEGPEYDKFNDGILPICQMDKYKDNNLELGIPLEKLLNLKEDAVLHTAPTANRGDQMSMRGIANEIAAIFNRPIKREEVEVSCNGLNCNEHFDVEIIDDDTCKYYAIGIVKDVKTRPSPEWMARRLEASGMRSISNIVDITNYVMLEYGQPLHAFDLNKLPEKYLCVRRAKENEKIKTLDGVERELVSENVLIATKTKPVALAGVMGDETSEVGENTTDLAIESAYFTPVTNRRSSRAVGIRTEACARFERGVDIKSVNLALKRTMQLLVELADGKTAGVFEAGNIESDPLIVELRFNQVKRVLGIEVQRDKCIEILQNLDFIIIEEDDKTAKFEVPSYRTEDVYREIDLIEEISRIYGYDKIPETIPQRTQVPELPETELLSKQVKDILFGSGLHEAVNSSLVGYPLLNWCGIKADDSKAIKVTNPQSDEYTMLRQSMVPGMLQAVKLNIDRGQKDVTLFEIGKTYFIEKEATEKDPGSIENMMLTVAISGDSQKGIWNTQPKVDFYVLKGILERIFESFGLSSRLSLKPTSEISYLHPGRSAHIDVLGKPKSIDKDKTPYLGVIGQVHPETISNCKFGQDVFVLELDLKQLLLCIPKATIRYKKIAQYPAVVRDVAFVIDNKFSYEEITNIIKKAGSSLLKNIEIFDIYTGHPVPDGCRSVAIHLTLQDDSSTLTDEITDKEVNAIKEKLQKEFDVALR